MNLRTVISTFHLEPLSCPIVVASEPSVLDDLAFQAPRDCWES